MQIFKRTFAGVLLVLSYCGTAQAFYPHPAWAGYPPYYGPAPMQVAPYRPWPVYQPYYRYAPVAGYRHINYNKPWGQVRGGISPSGHFWVNIRFGGHYDDLRTLLALLQMSGSYQSQAYPSVPGLNGTADELTRLLSLKQNL